MKKPLVLVSLAALLAACGSGDNTDNGADTNSAQPPAPAASSPAPAVTPAPTPAADPPAAAAMTTIGALNLTLPIEVPPEIPAPADAAYIGENPQAAPYQAVQFSTAMDAAALAAELQAFATANDANYDPAIRQVSYLLQRGDTRWNVYAWVRTNEGQTILEIGMTQIPE